MCVLLLGSFLSCVMLGDLVLAAALAIVQAFSDAPALILAPEPPSFEKGLASRDDFSF